MPPQLVGRLARAVTPEEREHACACCKLALVCKFSKHYFVVLGSCSHCGGAWKFVMERDPACRKSVSVLAVAATLACPLARATLRRPECPWCSGADYEEA